MKNIILANIKRIWFLKSSKIFLNTLIGTSVLLGAIFTLTTNVTQGTPLTGLSTMDVYSANMLGVDLGAILLIIFTAVTISREFSTNSISMSLGITPNRSKFFLGKFLTYFLLSSVVSLLLVGLIFLSTQLILAANGMELVSLYDELVRQFTLGVLIMPVFYSLITVGASFIFGGSMGAIMFSLLVMFLPALVRMFSETIQEIFLPLFPESAINSLSGTVAPGALEYIGVGISLLVLVIWIIISAGMGGIKFQKQDF